jgi:hypothetical protein
MELDISNDPEIERLGSQAAVAAYMEAHQRLRTRLPSVVVPRTRPQATLPLRSS